MTEADQHQIRRFRYLDVSGLLGIAHQVNLQCEALERLDPDGGSSVRREAMFRSAARLFLQIEQRLTEMGHLAAVPSIRALARTPAVDLPQWLSGRFPVRAQRLANHYDLVEYARTNQYVAMELDQDALMEGCSLWPRIVLGASVEKFCDADLHWYQHITGHFCIFLRSLSSASLNMGLLARVQGCGSHMQLKPYAIWQ